MIRYSDSLACYKDVVYSKNGGSYNKGFSQIKPLARYKPMATEESCIIVKASFKLVKYTWFILNCNFVYFLFYIFRYLF